MYFPYMSYHTAAIQGALYRRHKVSQSDCSEHGFKPLTFRLQVRKALITGSRSSIVVDLVIRRSRVRFLSGIIRILITK